MKGLILNQFYSLKGTLLICVSVFVLGILLFCFTEENIFLQFFMVCGTMLLPLSTVSAFKQDASSKWLRFEIVFPLKRSTIVLSRYIYQILLIIFSAFLTSVSFYVLDYFFTIEGYVFAQVLLLMLGSVLVGCGLGYALLYALAEDKTHTIENISAIASVVIYIGSSSLFNWIFPENLQSDWNYVLAVFVFGVLVFVCSFFFSLHTYQKRDYS